MKGAKKIYTAVQKASVQLVVLQRELHDAGLHATAQKVNEASKKLGWEAAEKLTKITKRKEKS